MKTDLKLTQDTRFEYGQALYWFCCDWHNGQSSVLYSVLSRLNYHPSPMESCCDPESFAEEVYSELDTLAAKDYRLAEKRAESIMQAIDLSFAEDI